jgi:hypothetical protein
MKKILAIVSLILILFMMVAIPIFAISNPTTIRFYGANTPNIIRAKGFTNVNETGDMLFMAESYVHYVSTPTDYTASQAFSYEILSSDGTTVLESVPIANYECKVIGIYQTAAQVTALGLASGSSYLQRITGNPSIFGATVEGTNMVTTTMVTSSWIDQSVGKGTTSDALVSYILQIASDLQANDSVSTYLTTIQGTQYLTDVGGNIFLQGVPNLSNYAIGAFSTTASVNSPSAMPSGGAINTQGGMGGNAPSVSSSVGSTTASGITNLGLWLGGSHMPQWMAGMVGLLIIMGVLAIVFYKITSHPVVPIVIGVMVLPMAGYLGFIPIALVFAISMAVFILTVWYFASRGYI